MLALVTLLPFWFLAATCHQAVAEEQPSFIGLAANGSFVVDPGQQANGTCARQLFLGGLDVAALLESHSRQISKLNDIVEELALEVKALRDLNEAQRKIIEDQLVVQQGLNETLKAQQTQQLNINTTLQQLVLASANASTASSQGENTTIRVGNATANGYMYLGPLLYQWGLQIAGPSGAFATFPVPFKREVFAVTLGIRAIGAQPVSMEAPSLVRFKLAAGSGSQAIYWQAIGI